MLQGGCRSRPRGAAPRQAGFSLVELLVTVVIMAEILVGLLILFDSSSRLARAQTQVAELQQSLRVGQSELTRFTRMVGRGGLPVTPLSQAGRTNTGTFPTSSPAVSVFNNVEEKTIVQLLDSTALAGDDDVILPGSDVLVMRGVFSTPMYYVDPPVNIGEASWIINDGDETNEIGGTITLPERTRVTGLSYWDYPQDIAELGERLEEARVDEESLGLIMRDTINPSAYVVVAFDWDNTLQTDLVPAQCDNITFNAALATEHIPQCIKFNVELDPDETASNGPGRAYSELTAGNNLDVGAGAGHELVIDDDTDFRVQLPSKIGSIGVLEEHRLFVRAEWEVPGQVDTRLTPVLARAEFLPGTNTLIDQIDIADNVLDLQIAVGADADRENSIEGYGNVRDTGSGADEVLFNSGDDTDSDGTIPATSVATGTDNSLQWTSESLEFHFLRLNTLVQARFPDPKHRAPKIDFIEDFDRGATFEVEGIEHTFNSETDLRYRRRWLQTVIELRNLQ